MRLHRRMAAAVADGGIGELLRRGKSWLYRSVTGRPHSDAGQRTASAAPAPTAREEWVRLEADAERLREGWRALEAESRRLAQHASDLQQQQEAAGTQAAREEEARVRAIREQEARDEEEIARERPRFAELAEQFRAEASRRGLTEAAGLYWYHTIDLGGGLVTPGIYDFRQRLHEYPFPESLAGKTALDVGSATGFFAFELERRGAEVVSVELPSVAEWDLIWSDREPLIRSLQQTYQAKTLEEMEWHRRHGPFQFCHRMLGSRVRRCLSRIYDLNAEKLGSDGFDLIFLGDILGHLFSPLTALNTLAPLCREKMIISLDLVSPPVVSLHPSLHYQGGEARVGNGMFWFQPNWEALRQMLRRVGFQHVERTGESRVLARTHGAPWQWMRRDLIVATR